MARRSGGDDLDDLYIFETDDTVDQPEAAAHQPAAAPAAAKKKKTGKRKRPAREAEEKASAVTHLEELCGGASTLLPLLEALPKRSALRRMEPASVVVVCSSALRCTEVIRAVKAQCRCSVGKLFAKHMKLGEQLAELERETPVVCVGTAHRVGQLLSSSHAGALQASSVRLLLVDGTPDAKNFTMLTQAESSAALRELLEGHFLTGGDAGERSIQLFTYSAPKYVGSKQ